MMFRALGPLLLAITPVALADELPFEKRLMELAASQSQVVELSSIGSSRGGRPLHLVRLGERGAEGAADRPTLVIVAGINPMHRVGVDTAVGVAEKLAAEHKDLLKSVNFAILPCLNPDTFAWHLDKGHPKTDWSRTMVPLDTDRDSRINEDPAEDLNGDGVISMMRIKDPKPGSGLKAEYCVDPENTKLLKKPDAGKSERAEYALLVEGIDNDGDGKFNEDGVGGSGGGVDLDMNFPARWPEQWTDGAGRFAPCEPESRALVEWMLKQENVAAVLVFGPADTLVNIPQAGKFDQTGQVPLGIEEGDKAMYEMVSELFKEATNQTGAPTAEMAGSFWTWAYAQYGVPTFETPVWVRRDLVKKEEPKKEGEVEKKEGEPKPDAAAAPPGEMSPEQLRVRMQEFADATPEQRQRMIQEFQNLPADVRERMQARIAGGGGRGGQPAGGAQPPQPGGPGGPPGGGRGGRGRGGPGGRGGGGEAPSSGDAGKKPGEPTGDDAKWLKYDDEQIKDGAASGFLDWKPFKHPQLGDVEIGGFVPGFKLNPPDSELPRLVEEQARFIEALCGKFPKIAADPVTVASAGTGLWRVSLRATNTGAMASMPAIGVKSRRDLPTILTIDVPLDRIVAGEKLVRSWSLAGSGGQVEAEWMITGDAGSTVEVEVRSNIGPKFKIPVKLEEVGR
jgi:Zinc carboxypeptidase